MIKPVYPNEKKLFLIAFVISAALWLAVVIATKGIFLLLLPVFFIIYLFAQSGFISYLKGTGALVSDSQFPDLQARMKACAEKIGLQVVPQVYILHGNGVFNAFATRFLRKNYIILLSDVLDALEDHPEAINFYIGHEMGHIDRKHLLFEPFLSLALVLPLLGAGYSRAREYTCDLYGSTCCSPQAAQQGIAALAVGGRRYKTLNPQDFIAQTRETSGFWMSFHELISSYPWLVKRFAKVSPGFLKGTMPRRNVFAYIPALFIPRLNIMSVVVLYALFIGLSMGGILKGEELIKDAEQRVENTGSAAGFSAAELLEQAIEGVNKIAPKQLDDMTTLKGASAENGDTLVYNYELAGDQSTLDFEAFSGQIYSNNIQHWCNSPETEPFRTVGLKIIYRYSDAAGSRLGDVVIDTQDCES